MEYSPPGNSQRKRFAEEASFELTIELAKLTSSGEPLHIHVPTIGKAHQPVGDEWLVACFVLDVNWSKGKCKTDTFLEVFCK